MNRLYPECRAPKFWYWPLPWLVGLKIVRASKNGAKCFKKLEERSTIQCWITRRNLLSVCLQYVRPSGVCPLLPAPKDPPVEWLKLVRRPRRDKEHFDPSLPAKGAHLAFPVSRASISEQMGWELERPLAGSLLIVTHQLNAAGTSAIESEGT
jgi:hypothetical protein